MSETATAVECKGVRVPPSPFLTETRIRRIAEARYEGEEIAGALSVIGPSDRVLELGAGLGIVGAVIARNARPEAVLSFEANPDLIPHIKALHALNALEDRIELRNRVLLSSPNRPEAVTFYLRNSFLGSSLIDQDARQTRPVSVPTESFDTVRRAFRPTVLVMDIEGGELDLLKHADLSGIRAVVIEFHPNAYGIDGAKTCKDILREQGFRQDMSVSTRFVWTCTRAVAPSRLVTPPPDPAGGWSQSLRVVRNAVVQAPSENGLAVPCGVMTAEGEDVPEAPLWRNKRRLNLPFPPPAEPLEEIGGTWFWGGVMWSNFAHFIVESSCRLWGLDHLKQSPDGLLFIPRRNRPAGDLLDFQQAFLEACGIDLPVRVVQPAARVERLIVPGQGFGLGAISAGTAPFRAFMADRFGKDIAPEGPEKLYVSRSGLGPSRGALLGEGAIERHLAGQGYEIFHPERHPLGVQIARYKAARYILAAEGSALHVVAFSAGTDQRVGVIARRKSVATGHILTHLQGFTGRTPALFNHLSRVWHHADTGRARLAIGEPDMPALQAALSAEGFIEAGAYWEPLNAEAVQEALGEGYTLTPPNPV
ncbi:FkbM family methyltransferase [Pacificoceanicola onchidii]|uniref:FkbM family methyltransferase n=1 Tax=Pacificoceanicola onchidii TaxID=2562685 RepID=UPI0010A611A2|nr:FkbM family methyltransferase [Pacificoceanicola onchidii]